MLAGALVTLFFAKNGGQTFEDLEAKRSVMIHPVKVTHPLLFNNWGVRFEDHVFHIFRNGWFDCRDAFHVVLWL